MRTKKLCEAEDRTAVDDRLGGGVGVGIAVRVLAEDSTGDGVEDWPT